MKKILFSLALMLTGITGAWAEEVTETYDFAAIAATGLSKPDVSATAVSQSGTNAQTVYVMNDVTGYALSGRFAINPTSGYQMYWLWRNTSTRTDQQGLAGAWYGTRTANTSFNISILNLKKDDKVTITYAFTNSAAKPTTCSANVISESKEGTGIAVGTALSSGTDYYMLAAGNLDLYITNNNMAISKVVIVTTKTTKYTATFTENNGLTPTVNIFSDEARTKGVANGQLEDGNTYYYTATFGATSEYADYNGSFTVSGAAPSESFTMDKKATYTLSIHATNANGDDLGEIATSADAYDGKSVTVGCPMYLTDANDKVTYKINGTSNSKTVTAASTGSKVLYDAYEGTAYFVEAEKVIGSDYRYTMENTVLSGAEGVYGGYFATENKGPYDVMTVPTSGTYTLKYGSYSRNVNHEGYLYIYNGTTKVATSDNIQTAYYTEFSTPNLYFAKDDVIKFHSTSSNIVFDYLLIEKVSDYQVLGERVGALDYTTGWSDFTNGLNKTPVFFKDGETAYYKFINHNSGTGYHYNNWNIWLATSASENIVNLCASGYANKQGNHEIGTFDNSANYNGTNVNFVTDLHDATVELYLAYDKTNGTVKCTAKTTTANGTALPDYVYTQSGVTADELKVYVSVDNCWLDVLAQGNSETITTNENGVASYVTTLPLDFTNCTDITAYVCTETSTSTVTLAKATVVPAGAAIVVKAADKAVTSHVVPVTAEGTPAGYANLFKAGAYTVAEGDYVYCLNLAGQFQKVDAGVTVPSDKAYLKTDAALSKVISIFDFDEATAIESVNNEQLTVNNGKFIQNGQLVIVKNGKQYNAAGAQVK